MADVSANWKPVFSGAGGELGSKFGHRAAIAMFEVSWSREVLLNFKGSFNA